MVFWKGKKKKKTDHLKQLCPNCLNSNLRYASSIASIYGPAMLLCPKCGYKGSIYIDVDGDDKKEALQMALLREEFADDLEETKTAEELARMCLAEKWSPDQANNSSPLRAWCPFCADVNVVCSICKCPPDICSEHATGGLIGKLNEMYDDEIPLSAVDPQIYSEIVHKFQLIADSSAESRQRGETQTTSSSSESALITCKFCQHNNRADRLECYNCGAPLHN